MTDALIIKTTTLRSVDPSIVVPVEVYVYEDGAALACHEGRSDVAYPGLRELEHDYQIDVAELDDGEPEITISNIHPSAYTDTEGALDCSCEFELYGVPLCGSLTLCRRAYDGAYDALGDSAATWISGVLLRDICNLCQGDIRRELLNHIAREAGAACDKYQPEDEP